MTELFGSYLGHALQCALAPNLQRLSARAAPADRLSVRLEQRSNSARASFTNSFELSSPRECVDLGSHFERNTSRIYACDSAALGIIPFSSAIIPTSSNDPTVWPRIGSACAASIV